MQFVGAFGFTYSAVGGFGIGLLRLRIIQAGVTNKSFLCVNVIGEWLKIENASSFTGIRGNGTIRNTWCLALIILTGSWAVVVTITYTYVVSSKKTSFVQ